VERPIFRNCGKMPVQARDVAVSTTSSSPGQERRGLPPRARVSLTEEVKATHVAQLREDGEIVHSVPLIGCLVRCPPKLASSKLKAIVGWFYNHLARLIYAEATSWKPTDLRELRNYVDTARRGHYLEGSAGEFIMPNDTLYDRESRLYVDVEAFQDGTLIWSEPREPVTYAFPFGRSPPTALRVVIAMEQVGMFTSAGLRAVSQIWGNLEYKDDQDHQDSEKLTKGATTRRRTPATVGTARACRGTLRTLADADVQP
jgi:hypothetical protein